MAFILLTLAVCVLTSMATEDTNVQYWTYKVHAVVSITYTLYNCSDSNHTFSDIRDAISIAADAEMVIGRYLNFTENQCAVHGQTGFMKDNQMAINVTAWTNSRQYFRATPDYLTSDLFESHLTREMEGNYEGLNIVEFESIILHTHNGEDDVFAWSDWLNFKKYTLFQWIVVDMIMLTISIGFVCVIYWMHCRVSNASDPYKNISFTRLEFTKSLIDEERADLNHRQCLTLGSTPGTLVEMRIL